MLRKLTLETAIVLSVGLASITITTIPAAAGHYHQACYLLLSPPLLLSVLSFLSVWLLSSPFTLQILWTVLGVLRIRGKPSRCGCGVIDGPPIPQKSAPAVALAGAKLRRPNPTSDRCGHRTGFDRVRY